MSSPPPTTTPTKPEHPEWMLALKGGCPYIKDEKGDTKAEADTNLSTAIDNTDITNNTNTNTNTNTIAKENTAMNVDNSNTEKANLNPLNNMLLEEKQLPSPGQDSPLPITRRMSSIPRGDFKPDHQSGETDSWEYPSQQMFFNAMKRKGHEPTENDMSTIVGMHNAVNEYTWTQLMQWENLLHPDTADKVRLKKFSGDATKFTPKARFRQLLGYTLPFDRHDWVITRNGEDVHYVIDFYKANPDQPFGMHVDVRPCVDSVENIWDRLRLNVVKLKQFATTNIGNTSEPQRQPQQPQGTADHTSRRWGFI